MRLDLDLRPMTAGQLRQELMRIRQLIRRHRQASGKPVVGIMIYSSMNVRCRMLNPLDE
jgi:hypothetical protein